MESAGMSRAMGVIEPLNNNRYNGIGNAIRMARHESKERYVSPSMKANDALIMERGPCPRYLQRIPSIPSILDANERKSEQYR
jgi:hypothetical protein